MSDEPLPLLWVYGPGGVGKTTVGWELFRRLSHEGTPIGYVDIDQIGMCYAPPTAADWAPEPASDPVRYQRKYRSLDIVAARFRDAGARGLVVSGIVDPLRGVDASMVPHTAVTPCRLRVDRDEHLRRLAGRGRPGEPIEAVLQDAEELDRGPRGARGVVVETTGLGVREVVGRVLGAVAGWPGPGDGHASAGDGPYGGATDAPGEILWLCGPTGVGKSTVAWSVYVKSRLAGRHTAFLDLDQVGFLRPGSCADPGNHRLKAGNLAGVWNGFSASGARRLVVCGPLAQPEASGLYRAALPEATITMWRMGVGRGELQDRIMRRAGGEAPGAGMPGDEIKGLSRSELVEVGDRAWRQAVALERSGVADFDVATDGRASAEIAEEVLRRSGW